MASEYPSCPDGTQRVSAMAEGGATEAERQRRLEAQLEAEREKRVQHLMEVAARRIGQQGLGRGWSAWRRWLSHDATERAAEASRQCSLAYARWLAHWTRAAEQRALLATAGAARFYGGAMRALRLWRLKWAEISLSQVVARLIERWDELGDGVKTEIADLVSHD